MITAHLIIQFNSYCRLPTDVRASGSAEIQYLKLFIQYEITATSIFPNAEDSRVFWTCRIFSVLTYALPVQSENISAVLLLIDTNDTRQETNKASAIEEA